MIFSDDEIEQVRQALENQFGLDAELTQRCGDLMRMGAYDDAVLKGFVLLEERLRKAAAPDKKKLTGVPLAQYTFSQDGPFSRQVRDGMTDLYSGAFKLFRNPAAHGHVNYDPAKGKSAIGLVNLLLILFNELKGPQLQLSANVEAVLAELEHDAAYGPEISGYLRSFVVDCIQAGIVPQTAAKQWIPVRARALVKYPHWSEARSHPVAVFYIYSANHEKELWFPVNQFHRNIVGLNVKATQSELAELGFQVSGKYKDYNIDLRSHLKQGFFDKLLGLTLRLAKDFQETLRQQ